MRSRWFHRPTLHQQGIEKRASWLELFHDLIFVAAFILLGRGLGQMPSGEGVLGFAAIFAPMWIAWTGFTFYVNRFTIDDFSHRVMVMLLLFAVGAMAISSADVLRGDPHVFAWSFAVAQALVAALYFRSYRQEASSRDYSRYWGSVFAIGAVFWGVSGFIETPWCYVLWAIGALGVMAAPFHKVSRALNLRYPWDESHLSERYGLLTLFIIAETFVTVLSDLSGTGLSAIMRSSFVLVIMTCLWWIYFDDVGGSKIRRGRFSSLLWLYGHLPLHFGLVATGIATRHAALFDLSVPAPAGYRWLLSGALAVALASVALVDSVTERRQAELSDSLRVKVRFATALCVLVLAPASSGISALLYLSLTVALCVVQVVFDMVMAPFEEAPQFEVDETIADQIRRAAAEGAPKPKQERIDLSQTLRIGTPSNLRRDFYFYLMEGGWGRVLVSFIGIYLLLNLFFAALFMLEPGSISNTRPASFADSFFFSVQTMSTIGYGSMSPVTEYGHWLVTIESAVGMFFTALMTGLMFTKASRPVSSVLFSKVVVINEMDGKPTMSFRVGNARGNEVIDASMNVVVIKEYLSAEGQHMRRLYELDLVRARSPVFVLSWTAMHPIDEHSPIYGIDWNDPDGVVSFIVTLTGHDGTYNATTYARHTYMPSDVRPNHRFDDIISLRSDQRMVIDYTKFHDTIPQVDTPPAGDTGP